MPQLTSIALWMSLENDGQVRQLCFAEAAYFRQAEVDDDRGRSVTIDRGRRAQPIARFHHFVPRERQRQPKDAAQFAG